MMFLPPQFLWAEPVIIASIVVFVIDLIGNSITFSNKTLNALVTAIIFGAVFGAITFYGYGGIRMEAHTTPAANSPASTMKK